MKKPLVSVVTPSFNQSRFLVDNLRSVQNQTYRDIEHLVFDGGSTDGSVDVLRAAEGAYNLHWVSERDAGQTDAINKGFAVARGEIIGWINSDDAYFDTGAVQAAVDAFAKFPDADVIYGNAARIDAENRLISVWKVRPWDEKLLRETCCIVQPSVFLRRKVIDRFRLDPDYQVAMDYEFWLRISREHRFQYLNRILGVDRTQPGRKVLTMRDAMVNESLRASPEYGQLYAGRARWMASVARNQRDQILGIRELLRLRSFYEPAFSIHWRMPSLIFRQIRGRIGERRS